MRNAVTRILILFVFILAIPCFSKAQAIEAPCPFGTSPIGEYGQIINPQTGKIRQYACVDSSANLTMNNGSASGAINGGIKLVQTPGVFASFASATTFTQQYAQTNTSGNLLLVFLGLAVGSSGNTCTPSDTDSDIFFQAGVSDIGQSTIFFAFAKGGPLNTVTCSMSGSSTGTLSVAEYSGVLNQHPVAAQVIPSGNPIGLISWSIYNPVQGSLLVAMNSTNGNSASYVNSTGCNPRTPLLNVTNIWCDNSNAPIGTNTVLWSQVGIAGGTDFITKAVIFLPASITSIPIPIHIRLTQTMLSGTGGGSSTSPVTDKFIQGNNVGNCILVMTKQFQTANNITSVSDSAGNSYSLAASGAQSDSGGFAFYADYLATATVNSNADNTISVAFSAGTLSMAAVELSGTTCGKDSSVLGTTFYNLTTSGSNDIIFTIQGFGGGGVTWNGLSGTDIVQGNFVNTQTEINYFSSCQKNNTISSVISQSGSTAGGLTIALSPTINLACQPSSGSQSLAPTPIRALATGVGFGTATASSTLGFFGLGQNTTTAFTNTTTSIGPVLTQNEIVLGFTLGCGTGGVNASSGVVTLLQNNNPFTVSETATLGTNTSISDFSHPNPAGNSNVISAKVTTQAAETMANCLLTVFVTP